VQPQVYPPRATVPQSQGRLTRVETFVLSAVMNLAACFGASQRTLWTFLQGADRTRVPFSGDQSGANLDRFLDSIKLTREEIFITSAALCNPRSESGANRRPAQKELKNCSSFLRRTIEVVNPRVIVTLGSVALEALKRIQYHEFNLKESAAQIQSWNNRVLVPIYHPSPQVLASHRREAEQLQDYQVVAKAVRG